MNSAVGSATQRSNVTVFLVSADFFTSRIEYLIESVGMKRETANAARRALRALSFALSLVYLLSGSTLYADSFGWKAVTGDVEDIVFPGPDALANADHHDGHSHIHSHGKAGHSHGEVVHAWTLRADDGETYSLSFRGKAPKLHAGERVTVFGIATSSKLEVSLITELSRFRTTPALTIDACLPNLPPPPGAPAAGLTIGASSPLSSVPQLSSIPGASKNLFLKFTGSSGFTWGGQYNVTTTPAYDTDGDATTFSTTELANINEIWSRVAEHYAPFNINVTTIQPADQSSGGVTMTVIVGGNGSWLGNYGGVSFVDGFTLPFSYPGQYTNYAFVFPANLGNGYPKYVAEAIAHEAGHGFGLQHQSTYNGTSKTNEYNPGDSQRSPIMGNSYSAARGLWWYGQSSVSYSVYQDDVAIISKSANGFGYRAPTAGSSMANAKAMTVSGSSVSGAGVISTLSQADWYSFTTGSGIVTFSVTPAQYGPDLDIVLELRSAQSLIASSDPSTLDASLSTTLAAGNYYIVVRSHGSVGDLGQYTISGSVVASSTPTPNPSPSPSPSASPTTLPTSTPLPTATPTATSTPTPTATATSTPFPVVTSTITPTSFTVEDDSPYYNIVTLVSDQSYVYVATTYHGEWGTNLKKCVDVGCTNYTFYDAPDNRSNIHVVDPATGKILRTYPDDMGMQISWISEPRNNMIIVFESEPPQGAENSQSTGTPHGRVSMLDLQDGSRKVLADNVSNSWSKPALDANGNVWYWNGTLLTEMIYSNGGPRSGVLFNERTWVFPSMFPTGPVVIDPDGVTAWATVNNSQGTGTPFVVKVTESGVMSSYNLPSNIQLGCTQFEKAANGPNNDLLIGAGCYNNPQIVSFSKATNTFQTTKLSAALNRPVSTVQDSQNRVWFGSLKPALNQLLSTSVVSTTVIDSPYFLADLRNPSGSDRIYWAGIRNYGWIDPYAPQGTPTPTSTPTRTATPTRFIACGDKRLRVGNERQARAADWLTRHIVYCS